MGHAQASMPVGQKAKGKIPTNPLLKGSTLPSSSTRGEISNTRIFWGGQVKTITASPSQLSSDTQAPDCPSRTSVIQSSSTFPLHHCQLLLPHYCLRNPKSKFGFSESLCCTSVAGRKARPPDCPPWSPPRDSAHVELNFEHLSSISQLRKPITQSRQNLGESGCFCLHSKPSAERDNIPSLIPNGKLKSTWNERLRNGPQCLRVIKKHIWYKERKNDGSSQRSVWLPGSRFA